MEEEDSFSFLSSCVLDISSFALCSRPPPKMAPATQPMTGYYEETYSALVEAGNEPARDRPGAGEIKVRWCYTGSSVNSSKMRKSRNVRKFQTMISSSIRKLHYGPL